VDVDAVFHKDICASFPVCARVCVRVSEKEKRKGCPMGAVSTEKKQIRTNDLESLKG